MKTINELCDLIRETAFAIHVYHGHGHLEKVYENALSRPLAKAGLSVRQQQPLQVFDEDGTVIGDFLPTCWLMTDSLLKSKPQSILLRSALCKS